MVNNRLPNPCRMALDGVGAPPRAPAAPRRRQAAQVSILLPTYNESQNIVGLLKSVAEHLPKNLRVETIVIDDNSPDGTGRIVEDYIGTVQRAANHAIGIVHRKAREGLGSAILRGIQHSTGSSIIVLDSDFSHPPSLIPKLIEAIRHPHCDIAVASRYAKGGAVMGWPMRRKILSRMATRIAKAGLGVEQDDPMSGFFAFKKSVVDGLKLDGLGYKMLLEILVKARGATVREIPYTFTDRRAGESKLGARTVLDYCRSVWRLYRYGRRTGAREPRPSVRFASKAARFYTVGATGLLVNYILSLLFVSGFEQVWYLHANLAGIAASMTSNFALNKYWTFEDRDFALRRTAAQYGKFVMFSSAGALVQLGMVYVLVESHSAAYPAALVLAVMTAAFGNFVLNKKWTFREKLWS